MWRIIAECWDVEIGAAIRLNTRRRMGHLDPPLPSPIERRVIREAAGYTREDFARFLHVSRRTIPKFGSARSGDPAPDRLPAVELESWRSAIRETGRATAILLRRPPSVRPGVPPIRTLRAVVMLYAGNLVLLVVPLLVLDRGIRWSDAPWSTSWLWGGAVLAWAALYRATCVGTMSRVVEAGNESEVLDAYRRRMFLLIAFANTPALLAFVAVFLGSTIIPYLVVVAVTLGLLAYGSPRVGDVRAVQEAMRQQGSPVDLAAVLMGRVEA